MSDTKYLVHPVHLSDVHWGVVIVRLALPSWITACLYEPLCRASYRPQLQYVLEFSLLPLLKRWHAASAVKTEFPRVEMEWVLHPKQPDGSSCGMMVIAQVSSHLGKTFAFQQHDITSEYVRVMRLRLLWMIMRKTLVVHPQPEEVRQTYGQLQKYFSDDDH